MSPSSDDARDKRLMDIFVSYLEKVPVEKVRDEPSDPEFEKLLRQHPDCREDLVSMHAGLKRFLTYVRALPKTDIQKEMEERSRPCTSAPFAARASAPPKHPYATTLRAVAWLSLIAAAVLLAVWWGPRAKEAEPSSLAVVRSSVAALALVEFSSSGAVSEEKRVAQARQSAGAGHLLRETEALIEDLHSSPTESHTGEFSLDGDAQPRPSKTPSDRMSRSISRKASQSVSRSGWR